MRKGVALLVTILLARGTAAVKPCEAGEIEVRTAYQKVVLDWERTRDYEGMMRGLGDLIQTVSGFAGDCFDLEKVKAVDTAKHCPSVHYSPVVLRLQPLSNSAEVLKTTEMIRDGGKLVNARLPNIPQFPSFEEGRLSCFADCEADFVTLYERLETLVLDLGTAPSRVVADLLLTVLQLAPLIADCAAYLF